MTINGEIVSNGTLNIITNNYTNVAAVTCSGQVKL